MRCLNFPVAILGLLFLFCVFSSCSKEDCLQDITGTYVGTESCPGANNNLTVVIGESSTEGNVVLSVSGSSLTFNGTITSNCGSINIPNQNVTSAGFPGNIDGSFNINGDNLTGTLTFSTGGICSYNLNKQ